MFFSVHLFLYFPPLPVSLWPFFMRTCFFFPFWITMKVVDNGKSFFYISFWLYHLFLQHILFFMLKAVWIYLAFSVSWFTISLAPIPCVKPAGVSALVCVLCAWFLYQSISIPIFLSPPFSATTITISLTLWIWLHSSAISYLYFFF